MCSMLVFFQPLQNLSSQATTQSTPAGLYDPPFSPDFYGKALVSAAPMLDATEKFMG